MWRDIVPASSTYGITGYGAYVPRLRLQRSAIAQAHRWMAPALGAQARGHRAFCSWDEDSITMGVEAARDALGTRPRGTLRHAMFASTTMPFADLQNAAVLANALALSPDVLTLDIGQSQRAGTSGLLAALTQAQAPALFVASDRPRARPASAQEMSVGAGAAAFTLGEDEVIAQLCGAASRTAMFVDHFRSAESRHDYQWEERWIRDEGYLKLVPPVIASALGQAGITPAQVDHFILPAPLNGVASALARQVGIPATAQADALAEHGGHAGAAHGLLMLAHVLEQAQAGQHVLLVGFGQGCDALVFRITPAIAGFRPQRGVRAALADARVCDDYLRLLSYEGGVELDWGMRAERPVKTALTEQYRSNEAITHFRAGRCGHCGTLQFPQLPFCVQPGCNAPADGFEQVSLVDAPASVMTITADWLSYYPAPPLYLGFVQFDNGARVMMEIVDVGTDGVDIGTPLRMTFRIKDIDRARQYPRYFWKATPVTA